MIDELRITDLGVISEATLTLHPGFTVVTGETGAGKTMIVTGIGLLLGGRAEPAPSARGRAGPGGGPVPGLPTAASRGSTDAGGELDSDGEEAELLVARHLTAAGRSRALRRRDPGAGGGLRRHHRPS